MLLMIYFSQLQLGLAQHFIVATVATYMYYELLIGIIILSSLAKQNNTAACNNCIQFQLTDMLMPTIMKLTIELWDIKPQYKQ